MMTVQEINRELGNIDIYLLDQILKGRYPDNIKILDAGCGEGRNIIYFLNNGFDVSGIDSNEDAIRMLRFILKSNYPTHSVDKFVVGDINAMPYVDESFDLVICSAVLHFADSHEEFQRMFSELIRVTKNNGQLFVRMTSDIGLNMKDIQSSSGRSVLPDGNERYLITKPVIDELILENNLELIEPIKTVIVDDKRSMTNLVLKKK